MGAVESTEALEAAGVLPLGSKAVDAKLLCDQLTQLSRHDQRLSGSKPRTMYPSNIASNLNASGQEELDLSPKVFESASTELRERAEFRVKFLSKLSQSKAWVPSEERPPSHQTVIIFDWDDTLLCTTFLVCCRAKSRDDLPEETQSQLRKIAVTAAQLLEKASRLGQTFIITNAQTGWVEQSASNFLPEIQAALQRVRVISARSMYEPEYPGQVAAWKQQAFLEVRHQLDAETETVGNLVSIGDSAFEMDAAAAMGQEFAESCVKTVRFRQHPMPGQLLQELVLVLQKLGQIVARPRDMKLTFESQGRAQL